MMKCRLVSDIDETLLNSAIKHAGETKRLGVLLGFPQFSEINLTPEEIVGLGGAKNVFGELEGYLEVNRFLMNDPEFNRGLEPIDGAVEALNFFESSLAFYLTTRPKHLTTLTAQELENAGFPDRPVIARPDSVPVEQTAKWKLWTLTEIARNEGRTLMIDDSQNLKNTLDRKNLSNVHGILYKGPITENVPNALTWEQITKLLTNMEWSTLKKYLNHGVRS